MNCPHCQHRLTQKQIRTLNAQLNNSLRTVKAGGRNGGRQPKKKSDQTNKPARQITYEPMD